jgi:MFS family permease
MEGNAMDNEVATLGTGGTGPGVDAGRPGLLAPLRHRDFALLWTGQSFSSFGNQMFPIILAVLVLQRHSGAVGLGVMLAVQGLALAAGTLVAAAIGDRWPRTRVMIGTDAVRMLGVLAMAIDPLGMPTPILVALVIAVGVAEGMFLPAYNAVVPRVLPEERLQQGNALNATSFYVSMVLGPALAGILLAASGPRLGLWIDVATFVASLATLVLIREPAMDASDEQAGAGAGWLRRGLRDFAEGLGAVRQRPWIFASIGMATVVMTLSVAPAFLVAPIEAVDRLGGPAAYGAAFTALGVGSVLGSLLGGRIRTSRPGLVAILGVFTIFGSVISLALLPLAGVLTLWAVAGVGVTIFQILWTTALQKEVPDRLLGRVMALDWLGSQGLMPLGYALAGVLVHRVGTHPVMLASAVIVLVAAPLPLLVPGGATFSTPPGRAPRPATGPSGAGA